jgi:hypothetical protein
MAIIFEPSAHSYTSITPDEIKWVSATTLLSNFKQPFDGPTVAAKSSKSRKSKWHGMDPKTILSVWKAESDRACDLGNFYHNQREKDLLGCQTIVRHGKELPVYHPLYDHMGRKVASSQRLEEGIYPEHMVYLKSVGVCGQSDLVEVVDGHVHITDYKTNKEIKKESFTNWEGISQKMLAPLGHLDDCNYMHYNLQLSLYMYIILKHNPKLKAGTITIHHIKFEEQEFTDTFGYPISVLDGDGNPIVKEVIPYEMPYLKNEIIHILTWYERNRDKVKKKH